MRKSSLLRKLTFLIIGISLATLGSYAAYILNEFRLDKEKYVQQSNQYFVESAGREIQNRLEVARASLVSMREIVARSEDKAERDRLNRYFLKNSPLLIGFGLYSLSQNIVYFLQTANDPKLQINLEGANIVQLLAKTVASIQRAGGREQIEFGTGADFILVVEKYDNQGQVYSFGMIQKSALEISALGVGQRQVSLVMGSGAELDLAKLTLRAATPLVTLIRNAALKTPVESGSLRTEYPKGIGQIGGFYKISPDLLLISALDTRVAFDARDLLIRRSLYFALLVSAIGILIGLWYSATLTKPLRVLTTATENIAAGNYTTQIDIHSNDEVGQLAQAYRFLGERLLSREQELEKVTELAIKDSMTGLHNHRYFKQRMGELLALFKRHSTPFAICVVDVDFFKKFNDTYGHQQGDEVLKSLGQLLKNMVRTTDLPCRYGGEEFVILCPETNLEGGRGLAEKFRQAYSQMPITNLKDGSKISSTCSIGVTSTSAHNFETIEQMIEKADEHLYEAKEKGRNRVVAG